MNLPRQSVKMIDGRGTYACGDAGIKRERRKETWDNGWVAPDPLHQTSHLHVVERLSHLMGVFFRPNCAVAGVSKWTQRGYFAPDFGVCRGKGLSVNCHVWGYPRSGRPVCLFGCCNQVSGWAVQSLPREKALPSWKLDLPSGKKTHFVSQPSKKNLLAWLFFMDTDFVTGATAKGWPTPDWSTDIVSDLHSNFFHLFLSCLSFFIS